MQQPAWHQPIKIAIPVLFGVFLSDWHNDSFASAMHSLPIGIGLQVIFVSGWVAIVHHRRHKKRTSGNVQSQTFGHDLRRAPLKVVSKT